MTRIWMPASLVMALTLAGCGDGVTTPNGPAVASVTVAPEDVILVIGEEVQFTATLRDSSGTVLSGRTVTWTTSPNGVALINDSGVAMGLAAGEVEVVASAEAVQGTADLRVVTVRIGSVTLDVDSLALVEGDTMRLTATVRDTAGAEVTDREVGWSVSDSLVASVSASGLVSGLSVGTAAITADVDGVTDSARVMVTPLVPFDSVSAGERHVCALTPDGVAYCWKENEYGQLGNGTTDSSSALVAVSGGLTFARVNGGQFHTCGLTSADKGMCWGNNVSLQLGVLPTGEMCDGNDCSTTPKAVLGNFNLSTIEAGRNHSCAIRSDGRTYCWGLNDYFQLGNDTTVMTHVPTQVSTDSTLLQLSTTYDHTCGVTEGGAALCWGQNAAGQLGDSTQIPRATPVVVKGGHGWRMVSAGADYTCGIATDDLTYCWGANFYGRLGDGTSTRQPLPVPVQGGHSFAAVSAGQQHTCGLTTGGAVYCWGHGTSGQLGDGQAEDSNVPVLVVGALTFKAVSVGYRRTCGVTTLGGLYCWGDNVLTPTRMPNP